jgi:cytoskeletal protein CcmA (bactofilin family)
MFGKKRKKSLQVTKVSSLIAGNVEIDGDVVFSGGLRVDGRIKGSLINRDGAKGLLVLSESGSIDGSVRTHDAVIDGRIHGNLRVDNFLELQERAHVEGDISYRQLQMDCGATVTGRVERLEDEDAGKKVLELTAPKSAATTQG